MKTLLVLFFVFFTSTAFAEPCTDTSESEQWVLVRDGVIGHAFWKADPKEIHTLELTNGFKAGIQISPVADEFYREYLAKDLSTPEMVKIEVFDMSRDAPVRLTQTYGASNSLQGYSAKGGADRVEEFGPEGLRLLLLKAHCVTKETLANK